MTSFHEYMDMIALLWPSLVTAVAVAVAGSVLGVLVVLRREALMALAVPQAVAVGAALGMRYAWPTLPPALGTVALTLGLLSWARLRRLDYLWLPAVYIAGLCIAFLLIANSGQHVADLQSQFTGMDVTVTIEEAAYIAPVLVMVAIITVVLWRRWLLLAQSPSMAQLAGLHPGRWDALFLTLLAIVVVMGASALGGVIVLVMLLLPAGAVLPWTRRVPGALGAALAVALGCMLAGFVLSVEEVWPMSHSIGGVAFAAFLVSNLLAMCRR